jgi:hypothetical protein
MQIRIQNGLPMQKQIWSKIPNADPFKNSDYGSGNAFPIWIRIQKETMPKQIPVLDLLQVTCC